MFREIEYQAYLALVRPQLEYIRCCTWDPHIQKQIKDIESVQRRAARFVKNEYSTAPGTATKLLNDLKWPTLDKRRKVARLTMMFKVVSGLSAIKFPPLCRKGDRVLDNSSLRSKFIHRQVGAKTNTYQHSFIARTIKDWNFK